jgi:enoyl-CoA hydratase/carnithine racemase
MPEITIGLFPDAGASQILGRLAKPAALFLGLTGSQVRASECLYLSLGTHYVQACADTLLAELVDNPWTLDEVEVVESVLDQLSQKSSDADSIKLVEQTVHASDDLRENLAEIDKLPSLQFEFRRGVKSMWTGCPVSLGLVNEQIIRSSKLDIADILRMELKVATHCAQFTDFHEGVRALIIDKDNQPNWSCNLEDENFESRVAAHFEAPWQINPLVDLGN